MKKWTFVICAYKMQQNNIALHLQFMVEYNLIMF